MVKHGAVQRGVRMGKLGLSLTGSYLAYQFQNLLLDKSERENRRKAFHTRSSQMVRKELEHLKGPVMKLGQILSMMGTTLPPEVISELAHLQGRAPGMHPSLARAQFKAALGKEPEELFREFEETPFAAASLGQVHRAITKTGEKVAVKIQYPAIRRAIENDFKLLKSASLPGRFSGHLPIELIEEIERGFLRETNYLDEGKSIEFFDTALAPLGFMRLPRVFWKCTAERVLTMSIVEGLHIDDFLTHKPPQELRDLIGTRLVQLYHFELRGPGAFHADPHPGNYFFGKDGSVGLIDFGSVKFCTEEFRELVQCFVDRAWLEGDKGFTRLLGLLCAHKLPPSSPGARRLTKMAITFYDVIFPTDEPGKVKVDFGDPKVINTMTRAWQTAVRSKAINPEFAFASRAELGLYHLLHKLGAKVDTAWVRREVDRLVGINPSAHRPDSASKLKSSVSQEQSSRRYSPFK